MQGYTRIPINVAGLDPTKCYLKSLEPTQPCINKIFTRDCQRLQPTYNVKPRVQNESYAAVVIVLIKCLEVAIGTIVHEKGHKSQGGLCG